MAKMSRDIMELVNTVPCCYWATSSKNGMPNVGPVGTTMAMSPDTVVAAGIMMGKTITNLRENPQAAVLVNSVPAASQKAGMSAQKYAEVTGAQIKGAVNLLTSGEVHEKMRGMVAQALGEQVAQAVNATLELKVEEVYSVSGAEPPKRIA